MKSKFRHIALTSAVALWSSLSDANVQAQEVMPFQNADLPIEQRVDDLLKRLTPQQKAMLMLDSSPAIPQLGIPAYNWWNEALHGCARSGLATVFPQAIGMAASFDDELLGKVFTIASDEQRIKYHEAKRKGESKRYKGLTVWTPNINIFRDPRWGRGQETYGEDPYLTTRMGIAVVNGLQGPDSTKYDKLHACVKHFAVHSGPEYNRHSFDAKDVSMRDLAETYLYAFDNVIKATDVQEVMCAYNRYEGEPCCGSNRLLAQILRNEWNYQGMVVSDCGAIRDFYETDAHHTHSDAATAAADAVLNGTDINCGSTYKNLPQALKRGLLKESDLDVSVRRLLTARFRLGDLDADSLVSWSHIPMSRLASAESNQIALQMARESMTLLQNRNHVLPLSGSWNKNSTDKTTKQGKTYAVIGPNAHDSLTLWGNYNGTAPHTVTILDGIRSKLGPNDRLIYTKGSEWVARETFTSHFERCSTAEGRGFTVDYYNNLNFEGLPVAHQLLTSPFHLCTSGATVFAPDVPLRDFSGRFHTTYQAESNGEILFDYFINGKCTIIVNSDTLATSRTGHGARRNKKTLKIEAGRSYDIQMDFCYTADDAQFNFDLGIMRQADIPALVKQVASADVVIYAGGISPQLEGEEMKVNFEGFKGGDRISIELPTVQREILQALHQAGKKVIFVNLSGSAIGLEPETESCDAILQAWYGGQQGGQAVADVLFGDYNPAGKLPITFYRNIDQLPDFENYNMPGHTYRYFTGDALFPFGFGLSYTTFDYGEATLLINPDNEEILKEDIRISKQNEKQNRKTYIKKFHVGDALSLLVPVCNSGSRDGDEVVQVYIRKNDDTQGPLRTLRGFKRVNIPAGVTANVLIPLTEENFRVYNEQTGKMEATAGEYTIYYGSSSDLKDLKSLTVKII